MREHGPRSLSFKDGELLPESSCFQRELVAPNEEGANIPDESYDERTHRSDLSRTDSAGKSNRVQCLDHLTDMVLMTHSPPRGTHVQGSRVACSRGCDLII